MFRVQQSKALAAVLGHTQSLHTNALDEAIALPTDFSAEIARNTQIYLQKETNITKVVDPLGGSFHVEKLTEELILKSWDIIQEIEEMGGMAKAIENGYPKMKIEEASAQKQARIDSGEEAIIGVNKFITENDTTIDILEVDNDAVRTKQVDRINHIKAARDQEEVELALKALEKAAEMDENLLELAIDAARKRATLGEISMAMENVFGRFQATSRIISGVYSSAIKNNEEFKKALELSDKFEEYDGRRPRNNDCKDGSGRT